MNAGKLNKFKYLNRNAYVIALFILAFLFSCGPEKPLKYSEPNTERSKKYSNVIKTKQYGDSVKLIVEQQGDIIIRHIIDLKHGKDDNFDNTYSVTSSYRRLNNDTTINSKFSIPIGEYYLYFESKTITKYCDSVIKTLVSDYDIESTKPYYEDLKKRATNKTKTPATTRDYELIEYFPFKMDKKGFNKKPKAILIEYYKTEFSGGKYFYVIKQNNDTSFLFHKMDYIN